MKKKLRGLAVHLLERLPLFALRRLHPRMFLAFFYHVVSDADLPHVQHYRYETTYEFERDITFLQRTFGIAQPLNAVPRSSYDFSDGALITFDDGFAECATTVAPILRRHGAKAIFFVTTSLIDNRTALYETRAALCVHAVAQAGAELTSRLLNDFRGSGKPEDTGRRLGVMRLGRGRVPAPATDDQRQLLEILLSLGAEDLPTIEWFCERIDIDIAGYIRQTEPYLSSAQIAELADDGFIVGAHSRSHRHLSRCSSDEAEAEIVDSCQTIAGLTGVSSVPFAFPYSSRGLSATFLEEVRRRNPVVGCYFDTRGLDPVCEWHINRVGGEAGWRSLPGRGSPARLTRRAFAGAIVKRWAWGEAP